MRKAWKAFDFDELRAHNNNVTYQHHITCEHGIMGCLMLLMGKVAEMIRTGAVRDMDNNMPVYGKLLADIIIYVDRLAKIAGLDMGELIRCSTTQQPIGPKTLDSRPADPPDQPISNPENLFPDTVPVMTMVRLQDAMATIQADRDLHREALIHAHRALISFAELIDRPFALDEFGDKLPNGEPDCSAADLFEELHSMDVIAAEALATVTGVLFPTKESKPR